MRTRTIGNGCKQVYGQDKKTGKWIPQNIMIPKSEIQKKGERIVVKNTTIVKKLGEMGITVSNITRMSSGGVSDYRYHIPKKGGRQ
jgi:hypothetical protein